MGVPSTHNDLLAWQEAMNLVEVVYRDTEDFPPREAYGLTAQVRRSAISVPSNLAEGTARQSRKELIQFVAICCGSLAELQTQLQLGFMTPDAPCLAQAARVGKLVGGLRRSLR
jgi:four helix bundle protein